MPADPTAGARLVAGCRPSTLAVTQTDWVLALLARATGQHLHRRTVTTLGDRDATALAAMPMSGVFVAELREALLDGVVDMAVHSMKDLPSAEHPGLVVAAVPVRERAGDVLVSLTGARRVAELPVGATVGTGAPRRRAQLLERRPDLRVVPIRGNVGTRLGRVAPGDLDAVVLAAAGLRRVDALPPDAAELSQEEMVPAPAQGALAVECRAGDTRSARLLAAVDDPAARATTAGERGVLAGLSADCAAAVGAYARLRGHRLDVTAVVLDPEGRRSMRVSATGSAAAPHDLGRRIADQLLARGAGDLLTADDEEDVEVRSP
jgi:hydroxymethylbilane synthase